MTEKKILVIEDNPMNMELVVDLLETYDFIVFAAENAESGIDLAKKHIPDLILMDISLPGMDGLVATTILKNDDVTKSIPVIALTAHAMDGDEEKALIAGCDSFLTKPIDTRQFPKKVAEIIENS